MPIIEKDILSPGSYLTGNGVAHFPPARIVRIYQAGKQLIADGFHSQIPYEHRDEAVPVNKLSMGEAPADDKDANTLKNNTGFVKDWYLKTNERGEPVLWASLDVQDKEAAEKIGKTILFVSPQVNDSWVNGKGKEYVDAPIHVALTNKPVIQNQQPFKPVQLPKGTFRLSCSMSLAHSKPTTPRQERGITSLKKQITTVPGDTAMRNFRKTMFSLAPDDLGGGGGKPAPAPVADAPVDAPVQPDLTSIAASLSVLSTEQFQAVIASLPADKQADLKTACMAAAAPVESESEPNPNGTALSADTDEDDKDDKAPAKGSDSPGDDGYTKMSLSDLAKDPRNARIAKLESERLEAQIDDLVETGRIKPIRASQLKAKLNGKTRLSLCLENYGDLSDVVSEISIRQGLSAGSEVPVKSTQTKLSVPDRPKASRIVEADAAKGAQVGEEMGRMA